MAPPTTIAGLTAPRGPSSLHSPGNSNIERILHNCRKSRRRSGRMSCLRRPGSGSEITKATEIRTCPKKIRKSTCSSRSMTRMRKSRANKSGQAEKRPSLTRTQGSSADRIELRSTTWRAAATQKFLWTRSLNGKTYLMSWQVYRNSSSRNSKRTIVIHRITKMMRKLKMNRKNVRNVHFNITIGCKEARLLRRRRIHSPTLEQFETILWRRYTK